MTEATNTTAQSRAVPLESADATQTTKATQTGNDTRSLGRRIKERLMAILNFLHKQTVLRFRARRSGKELAQLAKDEPLFRIPESTNPPAQTDASSQTDGSSQTAGVSVQTAGASQTADGFSQTDGASQTAGASPTADISVQTDGSVPSESTQDLLASVNGDTKL